MTRAKANAMECITYSYGLSPSFACDFLSFVMVLFLSACCGAAQAFEKGPDLTPTPATPADRVGRARWNPKSSSYIPRPETNEN